jgi:hypothetical protein
MKHEIFLLFGCTDCVNASSQNVVFSDLDFRDILVYSASTTSEIAKDISGNNMVVDTNHDQQIQLSEAERFISLT